MTEGHARGKLSALLEKRHALARAFLGRRSVSEQFAVIKPREDPAPAPLSFSQELLWFLDCLNPGTSTYNVPMACRLRGALDLAALRSSLEALVKRHEVLRSVFSVVGGRHVQVVHPQPNLPVPVSDLSALPEHEREAEAQHRILDAAALPFDLAAGHLIRASVLRLAPDEHILILILHHMVTDGWSRGILTRELAALYEAFSHGRPDPLTPLSIQYGDFAAWQRGTLEGEALQHQLAYWRSKLAGAPQLLELPADRQRPPIQSYQGARQLMALPAQLSERLNALGIRCNATLFITLYAAFLVLLYRYSGQEDLVVGAPVANRIRPEVEGLIGFFTNTLTLRTDLSGNPSFEELLGRARETALEAYAHQEMPFDKLVEELQPERSPGHSPIFQVMFMLQNPPKDALELPGLQIEPIEIDRWVARFDLSLSIAQRPQGMEACLEYNTDLFGKARMERMLGHYRTLLEGIVSDPRQPIARLPLLTAPERRRLLIELNDTAMEVPRDLCVHHLFEQQAERTPDVVAVEHHGSKLTYAQLNAEANRLARDLRERGVGPDGRVALCAERSLEMVVGVLGILKAGAAYVPIDPSYPAQRVALMCRDADVALVLTHGDISGTLAETEALCLPLAHDRQRFSADNLSSEFPSLCAAYVIYTSGSTGRPKGVVMIHAALVNLLYWHRKVLPGSARTLQFASIGFDVSFQELFATWFCGGTVVVVDDDERRDTPALLRLLDTLAVERLFAPVAVLQNLAVVSAGESVAPRALREVITAGEQLQMTPEIVSLLRRLPEVILQNHYGPTEAHAASSWMLAGDPDEWPSLPPIGTPITNAQIYLLDAGLQLVPEGVPGDLYVAGAGLGRGYLNRPDMTAERFVPNPFSAVPGARMYRTGDLARVMPDGCLEYLGRIDHQVKIRGFRVEPGEVESLLLQHPAVREAVVVTREDAPGARRLVAYVVGTDETLSVGQLRERLQEQLPVHMVPSAFVMLEQLPLNSNGKVDRKALPTPDDTMSARDAGYVAPRTEVEEALVEVWSRSLHVERIGIHDNFFELGGHSLLATQVIVRIREVFQADLPLRALFENPTVAGLSERIGKARGHEMASAPPLVRISREGRIPLSFSQQRLWFIDRLAPGSTVYNLLHALRLTGFLDVEALKRSLLEIVRRHEALRTTFRMEYDAPCQVIAEADTMLEVHDLGMFPAEDREREVRRWIQKDRRSFDLSEGPLFRSSLLRLGDEEHILLLTMHHIVSDGWSQGILARELATFYNALRAGEFSALPALPIQYADYAAWQREWLQGEVLERQITYWKQHLAGAPTLLELPADRVRLPVQTFRGAALRLELSSELTQGLKAIGQQEGATLFMTLLAAFQTLLSRYSGQEDILVGTPIANRTRAEIEGMIGFFLNTLVLRGNLSGDPSFKELLHRIRDEALGAYAHQDMPFDKLVDEIQPERSLSHTPIFQVIFTFQNTPREPVKLEGLTVEPMEIEGVTAAFDMRLVLSENGGKLRGILEYNTDLFDRERIERMGEHFRTLLKGIVTNPNCRLSRLPLLTEPERQLMAGWNATAREYSWKRCIHELFELQVERTPDAIAVEQSGERLTYAQLNRRANQLAHYLRAMGVGPDILVGLYVNRSIEMVVGLLGILKAGGAYVPLDPSYPLERLSQMLLDAGVFLVLTQQTLEDDLPSHSFEAVCLDRDWERIEQHGSDNPRSGVGPDNLIYVIYTSGSTGKPKGTAVYHRGFSNLMQWFIAEFAFCSADRTLVFSSISFDLTQKNVYAMLSVGGELHLAPTGIYDPKPIASAIAACSATYLNCTPSHFYPLISDTSEVGYQRLTSLRYVYLGGEPIHVSQLAGWLNHRLCHAQLVNTYGPTECSDVATSYTMPANLPILPQTLPIGAPIANVTHYVLDKYQNPVPVGVAGELCIGGAGVGHGYLGRPDLTAEMFLPDPFSNQAGARLYRTGDLCRYLPDGCLVFLGRLDYQVKIRGFRIEPGEIESVLAQHPSVREAVVIAREDVPGDKRLVAYVVGAEGALSGGELRQHLRGKLPEYMVPSAFVSMDALPYSSHGKVDRNALPVPDTDNRAGRAANVPPSTPVEEAMAEIWSEVLHMDSVGIYDDFFERGGHSLMATQVISRVRDTFQVEVPLRAVFDAPTIASFTELMLSDPEARTRIESVAELLAALKQLSEEELEERLRKANLMSGSPYSQ